VPLQSKRRRGRAPARDETGERAGFDAGQAVQFNRTLYGDLGLPVREVSQQNDNAAVFRALQDSKKAPQSRLKRPIVQK
jgi:hypothetical protein